MSKVVLITGCSTGIGRDIAQRLAQAGYTVIASARQTETLNDLPAALKLQLDVTQTDSINTAVVRTLQQFQRIDVLINNAGYGVRGAVEEVSDQQVQQMFDVNVFGALRMIRAVTPHMRKQRSGTIINISSIAGKLSTPTNGAYSASKFALEALSDALRVELAPFNISVVSIEPGPIKTHFDKTSLVHAQNILSNPDSPYQPLYRKTDQFAASMRQQEPGPEAVSRVIQKAMESAHPRARYLAGIPFPAKFAMYFRDFFWDFVLKQMARVVG